MITINTNKGLVRLENWEDVISRVGFSETLHPSEHELEAIIGRYNFGDKVQCGLANCRTPHTKGYLVSTKSGRETNVGKDCGKNFFGVDFEEMAKQFERMSTEQDNRELLWNFHFNIEELDVKINDLRKGKNGADWVQKNCSILYDSNSKMPKEVTRTMERLAKAKSGLLTRQREATKNEVENLEARLGKPIRQPHYIDESIGVIHGIEALYRENDLRDLIAVKIEERLKDFKSKNIDELTFSQLSEWKRWAISVEQVLETAYAAVAFGRILLTKRNLSPLLELPFMELDAAQKLSDFLDGIDKNQN